MTPISRRTGGLVVLLLALIALGIAVLIVAFLAGNGGSEVSTEDTSPAPGTMVDDVEPGSDSIVVDVEPGAGSVPDAAPLPARMTLQQIADGVGRLWPESYSASLWGVAAVEGWGCLPDTEDGLVTGSVATCRPDPPMAEGQYLVVTALVLDGAGVGQAIDGPVQEGDVLGVVGVAHGDTLNVRLQPGTNQPVVAELAPTAEVVATGRAWALPESTWYDVESGPGWVNSKYVAFLTATRKYRIRLPQEPEAGTFGELWQLYLDQLVLEEPSRTTVISVASTDSEITYDIVGIGDGIRVGMRFRIVTRDIHGDHAIDRVERTLFCSRHIDERRHRCA